MKFNSNNKYNSDGATFYDAELFRTFYPLRVCFCVLPNLTVDQNFLRFDNSKKSEVWQHLKNMISNEMKTIALFKIDNLI